LRDEVIAAIERTAASGDGVPAQSDGASFIV
jgi:hypothetical protein